MRRLLAALVVTASTLALADLTMVSEVVAEGKTRTITLSARGTRGYLELKEPDGPTRTVLREGAEKKLFLVDHAKRTVLVVTEEDSKATEARQAQMRAQLEAQLAKLPPEQRARIEQGMLGASASPPKRAPFTYEKKQGPARRVGPFTCEDYVVKREGAVRGEACFASWKSVGVAAADFAKTLADATPRPSPGSLVPGAVQADLEAGELAPGFPVWRKLLDDEGNATLETTVRSFSKEALPADKFEVPKDYAQKAMGDLLRGPPPGRPPR